MLDFGSPQEKNEVLTVAGLNRSVCALLERQFPLVWVRGEISNFVAAASGHWYFSLKDSQAQVRGVMFRARAALTDVKPRNGDQIEVRARVTLYEPRGDFQLSVEAMRYAGKGSLAEQFERLKEKLSAAGLFDAQRKRPIPEAVTRLAVITSATGAALRDVLTTLRRRSPQTEVILIPSQVQGEIAPKQLISAFAAVEILNRGASPIQVVLLVRGGGSLEDLWAFNDEALAHAITSCSVPVISGVGHETDFTIADFVADVRAATPTAAAQLASSDQAQTIRYVDSLRAQLQRNMLRLKSQNTQRLDFAARLLKSPQAQLAFQQERVKTAARALQYLMTTRYAAEHQRVEQIARRVQRPSLARPLLNLNELARRLSLAEQSRLATARQRVFQLTQALRLVSPNAVLERGYAIVQNQQGQVITASQQTEAGQSLRVKLHQGELQTQVLGAASKP